MTDTTTEDRHARPFADWLREQSGGDTHEELGEGLHDLIARVRDTGKGGKLTLTVSIKPLKDDLNVLIVTDEIKLSLPEHDRKGSMFYADDDNNLVRNDPRQLSFDSLREVPPPTHADVDQTTGEIKDAR
jgi:hypothetical protein